MNGLTITSSTTITNTFTATHSHTQDTVAQRIFTKFQQHSLIYLQTMVQQKNIQQYICGCI